MTQVEKSNKIISKLVVCLDALTVNLIFLIFRFFWIQYNEPIVPVGSSLFMMLISLTLSYLLCSFFGESILYYRRVRPDQIARKTISRMVVFMLIWLLVSMILEVGIAFSKPIAIYFVVTTVIITSTRVLYNSILKAYRKRGRNLCNVVYIGSGSNLKELYNEMSQHLATGYNVLGYFDQLPSPRFQDLCPCLGRVEDSIDYLNKHRVDRVYCGLPSSESHVILPLINHCEGHLIRFFSVPNFRNYCQRRVSLEMFSNVPLLTIREEPLSLPINRAFKRMFDIAFSLCFICTLFLPIYIIVAIITKITLPGPVFFKQKRHGLDGKEFYMYKFRSMKVNKDADTLQATKNDPRKTKWGNFLRKTSIDEMPQFINVFLGDMSIVGPRPHMLKHTEEYSQLIGTYMVRHFIKPGVTGWAQVTGFRGETKELSDMEGRVKADIWYIEHWTFTLDLYIIYKTVANIVGYKDKKAY